MGSLLLSLLLPLTAFAVDPALVGRCEKISAEFREMEKLAPKSCDEARAVHKQFQLAYIEVNHLCRQIEARVLAGPIKLKLGTEDEMRSEAMEQKRKDMEERYAQTNRVAHELLLTPIDTDSPARPPAMVADDCRNELDAYAKVRRIVLSAFGRFHGQIDLDDDSLFQQASDRALPKGTAPAATAVPREPGR